MWGVGMAVGWGLKGGYRADRDKEREVSHRERSRLVQGACEGDVETLLPQPTFHTKQKDVYQDFSFDSGVTWGGSGWGCRCRGAAVQSLRVPSGEVRWGTVGGRGGGAVCHVVVAVFLRRGARLGEQACHTGKILESYRRLADAEQH